MDANNIKTELDELLAKLSDPEFLSSAQDEAKKAGARIQKLQRMLTAHEALKNTENELRALEDLKKESGATDEIAALEAEIAANAEAARAKIAELENENVSAPPPSDMIMEIRAGAGGNEASLFAAELFSLYSKFAERRGWEVNIISKSESEASGYKEIIFEINGQDAYKTLRYESGVHRVQRIPITEKQGRIHTSTASVAVLPQVKDIDVELRPQDIKVEFHKSSGPGGQNVNKVETAVRITHLPTGFVVGSQEGRSQLKNRERAMSLLRARIYDIRRQTEEKKLAAERKSQIGTGDRSEKIRTYNFPQDRVTDHRINESWHNIESIMEGKIDDIVAAFQTK
ncbi:MAG: Peptide chain release factor 1 [Parcubacteria group bacterium GW2011_GWA1_51_12]|nr:MAG: Peptide chain release factor 1 [Parcubacteria group bacterium GW2011_GWA1_51_12]